MCGIGATIINAPIVIAAAEEKSPTPTADSSAPVTTTASSSSTTTASLADEWSRRLVATLQPRGPDVQRAITIPLSSSSSLVLAAAVLHLRGAEGQPTVQPLRDEGSGNVLCWNGEVWRGLDIPNGTNDTHVLLHQLTLACATATTTIDHSVMSIMERIEGPWAFIFWHAATRTLWYGRDKLGRRSFLTCSDPQRGASIILNSVAAFTDSDGKTTPHLMDTSLKWQELATTGLFCLRFGTKDASPSTTAISLEHHYWAHVRAAQTDLPAMISPSQLASSGQLHREISPISDTVSSTDLIPDLHTLEQLIAACPTVAHLLQHNLPSSSPSAVLPSGECLQLAGADALTCHQFIYHLSESVRRRIVSLPPRSIRSATGHRTARVGVLFSGGIDCLLLALLTHCHLQPADEPIDLINVAFAGDLPASAVRRFVPDRVTAINGVHELRAITKHTGRPWNLIEVNLTLKDMEHSSRSVLHLMHPSHTIMDFNIATVLWSAAQARGHILAEGDVTAPITSPWCRYNTNFHTLASSTKSSSTETKDNTSATDEAPAKKTKGKGKLIDVEASERRQQKQWAEQEAKRAARAAEREAKAKAANGTTDAADGGNGAVAATTNDNTSVAGTTTTPTPVVADATSTTNGKSRTEARREMKQAIKEERAQFKTAASAAKKAPKGESKRGKTGGDDADDEDGEDDSADIAALTDALLAPLSAVDRALQSQAKVGSLARVLLCGIGADEQLAGYGRHRTVFKARGDTGLRAELAKDFTRLWRRNLGRDDRMISDAGREGRHPFLDESLTSWIHSLPLHSICNLTLPPGVGDKMVLRRAAYLLGLRRGASLVKRAMQFGSRVSNKRVAGYLDMSPAVQIATIVNPNFLHPTTLASVTISSASGEDGKDDSTHAAAAASLASSAQRRGGKHNKGKAFTNSRHHLPESLSKKLNRDKKDAVWAAEAALAGHPTTQPSSSSPSTSIVTETVASPATPPAS